ncbi:MAG TPA: biotin/lipoyl-containing protein [Tepidisphaeraceae bacterium]|nr:biotin/lipoyl-containing protein [Tepidisphaeraceae bacterium]
MGSSERIVAGWMSALIACLIVSWIVPGAYRDWVFPYGFFAVGVIALLLYRRPERAAVRAAAGLCPDCGYDLRGSPEQCPECGRASPLGPQPLASAAEGGRVEVVVPPLGEGVETAVLNGWHRADGEVVLTGVALCEVETKDATADLVSPARGRLRRTVAAGVTVRVG